MAENTPENDKQEEIDLIELARKVWARRRYVVKSICIGAAAGLVIGFSIPKEFTTTIKMAPEGLKSTAKAGGMADLAALAGFDLGSAGNADGINLTLYPDVVSSTPFMIEMSRAKVQGSKMQEPATLYDYLDEELSAPWWSYVISAPMKLIGLITAPDEDEDDGTTEIDPYELSQKQNQILDNLRQRISVSVDKKTGVITATATMQDAKVAAATADTLVGKLQEYISRYRTEKAKLDLEFTQTLYEEAQQKYYDAQKRYAVHMDATQNTVRQSAKVEQERLQNEQQLAFSVYNQLAQQLETAKIKVQEQTPCVTIIEPASVPVRRSNTSKLVLLIAFTFLGAFIGIGWIVAKDLFFNSKEVKTVISEEGTPDETAKHE